MSTATPMSTRVPMPTRDVRMLLIKWGVPLLVTLLVFLFWGGESIVNNVFVGLFSLGNTPYDAPTLILAAIFTLISYATLIALVGYLVAADDGRQGIVEPWITIAVFGLVPLLLVIATGLVIGLALCALIWPFYFYLRNRVRKTSGELALKNVPVLNAAQRGFMRQRAATGGLWFGIILAAMLVIVDLIFFLIGSLSLTLLLCVVGLATVIAASSYFLGRLGGTVALRRVLTPKVNGNPGSPGARVSRKRQLEVLSSTRLREASKDIVPNALPLRTAGAQRFFLILLLAFVLFYPALDPFLFGYGTNGRIAGYGDAGYYVILALGLNIVVGFAGLLDLGYVAFFAIGSYTWGLIGSTQFTVLTNIPVNPQVWSWLFWPMIFVTALIASLWGVLLGAPTLRLRGDYLAIVTLGFGEIVPLFFLNLDRYTGGTNGIVGVFSPAFPGIQWSVITPIPYYYLILALIALSVLANLRLRDSRLGRAWVAIREDEIAASSSGINLVNTKLFAFAAGAFFSGIAGAYHAAKVGGVSPDTFSFGDSVIYLAMVVIGGIGSIPGVIVGALSVYAINQFILAQLDTLASDPRSFMFPIKVAIVHVFPGFTFGNIRNLIFGIILVSIMIFRPEGLLPSSRRRRELKGGNDEEVEVSALDASPGSAGFESEVHVD